MRSKRVVGPLLKSVEEISKQIGVYDRRIEEIDWRRRDQQV